MCRRLANTATVVCLLLSAAVGWIWIKAPSEREQLHILRVGTPDKYCFVAASMGQIQLTRLVPLPAPVVTPAEWARWRSEYRPDERFRWSGFSFDVVATGYRGVPMTSTAYVVGVPNWAILLVLLLVPAHRAIAATRRRRLQKAGCCFKCGYDLRASPDRCRAASWARRAR